MISGVNINLINKKMKKLDILIEEIELYKGKLLDKKYIYQELLEIRQELTKPLIIHDVVGSKLTESKKKEIKRKIKEQFTGIKY